jgi:hypothetical protein
MIEYLKSLFRRPTPMEMITRELAIAHLAKLEGETGMDFAKSVVDYNNAKIKRLEAHIATHAKSQA